MYLDIGKSIKYCFVVISGSQFRKSELGAKSEDKREKSVVIRFISEVSGRLVEEIIGAIGGVLVVKRE